jgi:hypothetical protein
MCKLSQTCVINDHSPMIEDSLAWFYGSSLHTMSCDHDCFPSIWSAAHRPVFCGIYIYLWMVLWLRGIRKIFPRIRATLDYVVAIATPIVPTATIQIRCIMLCPHSIRHVCIYCILDIRKRTENNKTPRPGNHYSCMDHVQSTLPLALAIPYVEKFIPSETKVGILNCTIEV